MLEIDLCFDEGSDQMGEVSLVQPYLGFYSFRFLSFSSNLFFVLIKSRPECNIKLYLMVRLLFWWMWSTFLLELLRSYRRVNTRSDSTSRSNRPVCKLLIFERTVCKKKKKKKKIEKFKKQLYKNWKYIMTVIV